MCVTASQKETLKRRESYYPDESIKKHLNEYVNDSNNKKNLNRDSKSALAERLVSSFLKEYRKTGNYPTKLTIQPPE